MIRGLWIIDACEQMPGTPTDSPMLIPGSPYGTTIQSLVSLLTANSNRHEKSDKEDSHWLRDSTKIGNFVEGVPI